MKYKNKEIEDLKVYCWSGGMSADQQKREAKGKLSSRNDL